MCETSSSNESSAAAGVARRMLRLAQEEARALGEGTLERLVHPGTPSFRCQPQACDALCCRSPYRVDPSEQEVDILIRRGEDPAAFLEEGGVIPLLTQPRGACSFLGDDLACGVYEGRPEGCVQYPYLLLFVPREGAPLVTARGPSEELDTAIEAAAGGSPQESGHVPLLLRDLACPGFTEEPLTFEQYADLLRNLRRLERCRIGAGACARHAPGGPLA